MNIYNLTLLPIRHDSMISAFTQILTERCGGKTDVDDDVYARRGRKTEQIGKEK